MAIALNNLLHNDPNQEPITLGQIVTRIVNSIMFNPSDNARYYLYANNLLNSPVEFDRYEDDPFIEGDLHIVICECDQKPKNCSCSNNIGLFNIVDYL